MRVKKSRGSRRRLDRKREAKFPVIGKKRVQPLPSPMTLEATFASVKPRHRPLDFKKVRDCAIEEHVGKVTRKLRTR